MDPDLDRDLDPNLEQHQQDRPPSPIAQSTWETWFQTWLEQLQAELPPYSGYELSLRLTDDADIRSLNGQYRQKDQPTDVLAFAALEVDYPQSYSPLSDVSPDPLYLGDIVISVETAQRQASQLGHSLQHELAWLAAHALLHLLGWDHPDELGLARMLEQQENLLKTVGLTVHADSIQQLLQLEYRNNPPEEV
ncbi:rRNA maturation RNase YbeY [Egbenema bharatensis]|uniref:rRNA maturation RNase YbeY n=1 Tax=Egbenema bharatensis TaxID=3463334 RepID=UPI003A8BBEFE